MKIFAGSAATLLALLLLTSCATEPSLRRRIITLNVATIVDVESTYAVLRRCPDCSEGNPLMRGPINRGRIITYGLQFGLNAVAAMLAQRAEQDHNPSSFWHYLPYSLIASHSLAGTLNVRMLNQLSGRLRPVNDGVVDTPIVLHGWPWPEPRVRTPQVP